MSDELPCPPDVAERRELAALRAEVERTRAENARLRTDVGDREDIDFELIKSLNRLHEDRSNLRAEVERLKAHIRMSDRLPGAMLETGAETFREVERLKAELERLTPAAADWHALLRRCIQHLPGMVSSGIDYPECWRVTIPWEPDHVDYWTEADAIAAIRRAAGLDREGGTDAQ